MDTKKENEIQTALKRIAEEVDKDPEVAKKTEAFQKKYCTLTPEDLALTFTV